MEEVELSPFNQEVVACFKDFIKYNVYLVHLDLQATGLIIPAIKYLTALLRKAQGLRSLHLCGNKGLNEEVFQWIKERIHARAMTEPVIVPPCKA